MKSLSKCQEIMIMQQEIYYLHYQSYYKPIVMDLSWQTSTGILQQINFTEKLGKDGGAARFFIAKKKQKTILNFSLDS